jgi:hypothetical protein
MDAHASWFNLIDPPEIPCVCSSLLPRINDRDDFPFSVSISRLPLKVLGLHSCLGLARRSPSLVKVAVVARVGRMSRARDGLKSSVFIRLN